MATKKTVVTEVASALGAAAARVENLKPKRSSNTKHAKAQPVAQASTTEPDSAVAPGVKAATVAIPSMTEREEIELVAYLYSEARGFQGGSQEEDWVRAEHEVGRRRAAKS